MVEAHSSGSLIWLGALVMVLIVVQILRTKTLKFTPPKHAGSAALVLGAIGMVVWILVQNIGVLIAGSILFGCGAIALAIETKNG